MFHLHSLALTSGGSADRSLGWLVLLCGFQHLTTFMRDPAGMTHVLVGMVWATKVSLASKID